MEGAVTTAGVLREARGLIDTPEKWIKGWFHCDDGGRYCVLGAVYEGARKLGAEGLTYRAVDALGHAIFGRPVDCSISAWNDALERTHADVLAAIDTAIAEEARA
jgi:hypothetical protein